MPTECNPNLFDFARVEGRAVTASFDGGAISSDAGALLLGAADHALGLTRHEADTASRHRHRQHRPRAVMGKPCALGKMRYG